MSNAEDSSSTAINSVSKSTPASISEKKITKKQLINMIDDLKKNPNDKVRILGDAGVTLVGAGLGAAAAGTLASAFGATSVFGVTTVASWLGVTAVAATPVGWVIGAAAAGGGLAYGISRIIHGGGLSEGRKLELLQKYKEQVKEMEIKETAGTICEEDKNSFIISMRELIDKEAISPDEAMALIEYVENGVIPISQAFETVHALLAETGPMKEPIVPATSISAKTVAESKPPLSAKQIKEIDELKMGYELGFFSDSDFEAKMQKITQG